MYTIRSIQPLTQTLKAEGKSIVLVTGFFDLLHAEHKNFLNKAKEEGDILMVGVESDARAKKIKGNQRPKQTQLLRCKNLLKLNSVDYCISLPDTFSKPQVRSQLIQNILPDILAISSHSPHQEEKRAIISKYKGKLKIVHSHNPKLSTTKLLDQSR